MSKQKNYGELKLNGQCLSCTEKIDVRVDPQEFPHSSEKTIKLWNDYCLNCRQDQIYICHICKIKFLEDEDTYWKDCCQECKQDTCIKCRDWDLETDYDDPSTCIKCSKKDKAATCIINE